MAGGLVYEGQVIKSWEQQDQEEGLVKQGYGRLTWPEGSYFEGYWEGNKAQG
jgi:hypothetical protein